MIKQIQKIYCNNCNSELYDNFIILNKGLHLYFSQVDTKTISRLDFCNFECFLEYFKKVFEVMSQCGGKRDRVSNIVQVLFEEIEGKIKEEEESNK